MLRAAGVPAAVAAILVTALVGFPGDQESRRPSRPAAAVTDAGDGAGQTDGQDTLTEDAAQRLAEATDERVEVTGLRGERRDVYANPDGTFTAVEHAEPVRTIRNGAWVPVDDALIKHGDTWSPTASTVNLEISDGGTGPFVHMETAGRELSLTWPGGPLPTPAVVDATATWADVLPDVDLVVRAETDGFSHLLVVKTAEAAANPELARLDLGLGTQALTMRETDAGALQAVDSQVDGVVFEAGAPMMWDSGGAASPTVSGTGPATKAAAGIEDTPLTPPDGANIAPVDVELSAGTLTLLPDRKMLADPATVFPVVIDPIKRTTSRSAWTSVMKGMPDEQDYKFSGSAGMGKCPIDYNPIACNGVDVRRLMYTMPTSFYKGKDILQTTLATRVTHIYNATPVDEPVRLYTIGGKNYGVGSSTDWGNTSDLWGDSHHLMTVDKAISPTSCSSSPNLRFESGEKGALTKAVQEAADGGWERMTFGLRAADEGDLKEWKRMCGNAILEVTYNRPPAQIRMSDMDSNPGGSCADKSGNVRRPHVDELPKLRVEAQDPDHSKSEAEQIRVQFKIDWTDVNGNAQTYPYETGYKSPAGTEFTHTIKVPKKLPAIPENALVRWSARAGDKAAWGPWSHEGSAVRCEFVLDTTVPGRPSVISKEFPPGTTKDRLGVGEAGTFTFSPNISDRYDDDVTKYVYDFNRDSAAPAVLKPSSPTASVSVPWTPAKDGRHLLTVTSYDAANNPSAEASYSFFVREGRGVAGQWNLADDPEGATHAVDEAQSGHLAEAGPGVSFGVPEGPGGKADSAVRLNGTADAYLQTDSPIMDTAKGFSASAWVRPASLTGDAVAVSQDGAGEPGFTLGYDSTAQAWAFTIPANDVESLGDWRVTATGTSRCKDGVVHAVCTGEWAHLAGVYDPTTDKMELFVNGEPRGTATRYSSWSSRGALQIGRAVAKSGYRANWNGDLAEVRVFDRYTPQAEIQKFLTVAPKRVAYWMLDTETSGASPAQDAGGQPLTLGGGASLMKQTQQDLEEGTNEPLVPTVDESGKAVPGGHLTLENGGYASTAAPPVSGEGSFTVAARAQLSTDTAEKDQVVMSLAGKNTNRFSVVFTKSPGDGLPGHWELVVPQADSTATNSAVVAEGASESPTNAGGQHLAVVYDALTKKLNLYVEGQLADEALVRDKNGAPVDGLGIRDVAASWPAVGGLQVGRSKLTATTWGNFLSGAVDDVRGYSGAADAIAVRRMTIPSTQPDL